MIKRNIDDGDYVVINRQSSAEIGDIVAVEIEGDSTSSKVQNKHLFDKRSG
jgi:SOS-response transcriptional repressor LexA